LRDTVTALAESGALGRALDRPGIGYSAVYHIEIALLFATLIVLGPLVRTAIHSPAQRGLNGKIGIADFPT